MAQDGSAAVLFSVADGGLGGGGTATATGGNSVCRRRSTEVVMVEAAGGGHVPAAAGPGTGGGGGGGGGGLVSGQPSGACNRSGGEWLGGWGVDWGRRPSAATALELKHKGACPWHARVPSALQRS